MPIMGGQQRAFARPDGNAGRCISSDENSKSPCIHRPVTIVRPHRRGGRVVEGAPLLREYTSKAYRGFESHLLRHFDFRSACRVLTLRWESWSPDWRCLAVARRRNLFPSKRESLAGNHFPRSCLGDLRKRIGDRPVTLPAIRMSPAMIRFCQKNVTNVSEGACPALLSISTKHPQNKTFLNKA